MRACGEGLRRSAFSLSGGEKGLRRVAVMPIRGDPCTEESRCQRHRDSQKNSSPASELAGLGFFWLGELRSPFLCAESEGFEPPVQSPVHRISSAARSTTPATFQEERKSTLFLIAAKVFRDFYLLLFCCSCAINSIAV